MKLMTAKIEELVRAGEELAQRYNPRCQCRQCRVEPPAVTRWRAAVKALEVKSER